ncbi:hypothetical protein PsYK624_090470 [Phanerochaete sordida]|uniref:BAG domain-containing protein n=1 Tax=Phanerochaete sordida TaxID=48140 RepID=A0A9P3LFQ9_9APHY|nr:hypothetical protein PsYK624_090470 [Phanerochaete sordida]
MFPYTYDYEPSMPQYAYGMPSYRSRRDSQYLQAFAEEEAARRQYEQALRQQEEARNRAARARLARQVYEQPSYNSYLANDDDDDYGYLGTAPRTTRRGYPAYTDYPYLTAQEQRALLQERQRMEAERREQQRRLEALERERELERQRIRALEEERKRRLLEEERRRRIMLEEEERQRRREEERLRREEEEYLRRASPQTASPFLPLEELLGLRPSRSLEPELNNSRRARTMSPANRTRTPHAAPQVQRSQSKAPATPATRTERASSRPPRPEPQAQSHRIPISSPKPSPKSTPAQPQPQQKPQTPPPRQYSPEEVEAAEKIQTFWRARHQRHASLAAIAALGSEFAQLKSNFALPPALDYTLNGEHFSVPTSGCDTSPDSAVERTSGDASLAFTPANAPLHAYEEALNRLLTRLDGVQSGGDRTVRNRRRALAREVEREAQRVERVKVAVWRAFVEKREGAKEEMSVDEAQDGQADDVQEEMQVDEDAPAALPEAQAEEAHPSEPAPETKDVESANNAPEHPADPEAEAADARAPAEEMDVEPTNTHNVEPAEPAVVDASDAEQSAPTETMDVEPENPSEENPGDDIVVEEADSTAAAPSEPTPDAVPIIVEEPDPDADDTPVEPTSVSADADADDIVEGVDEEPTEFLHAPLTADVLAPSPSPQPLSAPEPTHAPEPTSAPPALVPTSSEAGDSDHTPPHTPPALHEELAARAVTPTPQHLCAETVGVEKLCVEKAGAEKAGAERLQMLRPLVSAEWDEEGDFF